MPVNRKRPRVFLSLAPSTISMMDELKAFDKNRSRVVDEAVAYYNKCKIRR